MERTSSYRKFSLSHIIFIILIQISLITLVYSDDSRPNEASFTVKPGGEEHVFTHRLADTECTFTYTCQGGTGEAWKMTLAGQGDDHTLTCVVQRPGTYLHFEKFSLSYKSKGKMVVSYAHGAVEDKPLPQEQFSIDHKRKSVSSTEKFQNRVEQVMIQLSKSPGQKEGFDDHKENEKKKKAAEKAAKKDKRQEEKIERKHEQHAKKNKKKQKSDL